MVSDDAEYVVEILRNHRLGSETFVASDGNLSVRILDNSEIAEKVADILAEELDLRKESEPILRCRCGHPKVDHAHVDVSFWGVTIGACQANRGSLHPECDCLRWSLNQRYRYVTKWLDAPAGERTAG